MTIDERLEKLAERQQALAETFELVAGMQRETEESIEALGVRVSMKTGSRD